MKRYSIDDLEDALNKLTIRKGDCLFIHSSILSFGMPQNIKPIDLPQTFFKVLQEKVGKDGTLVVPTFNFNFCKGIPYHPSKSPAINMGVLSEYIRTHPKAKRSPHPIQSVAAIGKHADYLTQKNTSSAFGKESAFDRLIKLDSKILLLGTDFSYNSTIHWLEEKLKVPYRYWKNFEAGYQTENCTEKRKYTMYVRDLKSNPELDFRHIETVLKKKNSLHKTKLGEGLITLYKTQDFLEIAKGFLIENPYFFIKNHPNFEIENPGL